MVITVKKGCTGNKKEGLFEKVVEMKSGAKVVIRFGFIWNGEELESVSDGTVKRETPGFFEVARFEKNSFYFIESHNKDEVRKLVSDAFGEVKGFFVNED